MVAHSPHLRLVEAGPSAEPERLGLDDVFRRYAPYVAKIVLHVIGRNDEVEDVVQDVFLEAARGLHRLRHPGALKGWLATIAVRLARRRLQARRVRAFLGIDSGYDYSQLPDPAPSPSDRMLLARVFRVLDDLPVDDRVAWCLRHLEGEKLEEIANVCDCSLATVKRRIAAAQAVIEERVGS